MSRPKNHVSATRQPIQTMLTNSIKPPRSHVSFTRTDNIITTGYINRTQANIDHPPSAELLELMLTDISSIRTDSTTDV